MEINVINRLITLTILLITLSFGAQAAKQAKDLCRNHNQKGYFKKMISSSENRLNFNNYGGLLNGGVCWWHSRFTRNALYLAVFSPYKQRPNVAKTKRIIKAIRKGRRVVEIPGYSNLAHFSAQNRNLIQSELEKWQIIDGVINQQWIVGLWGGTTKPAAKLKKWMDKLYDYVVVKDNIGYQKIQIKGIDAHAWLIYDMKKTYNGYNLKVIDSNSSSTRTIHYYDGSETIKDPWYGSVIPYLGRKKEQRRLKRIVKKFCK